MATIKSSRGIFYKAGFKYQLNHTYSVNIGLYGYDISSRYIRLTADGLLVIYSGYCWDGPSGPTIDTKNFMRGSLVHDALYQLIREGKLPMEVRLFADRVLQIICIEDGMSDFRAWYVYTSVSKLAKSAADPSAKKPVLHAP
jgi:hypothetical protein